MSIDHVADRGAILLMPPAVAKLCMATPFGGLKVSPLRGFLAAISIIARSFPNDVMESTIWPFVELPLLPAAVLSSVYLAHHAERPGCGVGRDLVDGHSVEVGGIMAHHEQIALHHHRHRHEKEDEKKRQHTSSPARRVVS